MFDFAAPHAVRAVSRAKQLCNQMPQRDSQRAPAVPIWSFRRAHVAGIYSRAVSASDRAAGRDQPMSRSEDLAHQQVVPGHRCRRMQRPLNRLSVCARLHAMSSAVMCPRLGTSSDSSSPLMTMKLTQHPVQPIRFFLRGAWRRALAHRLLPSVDAWQPRDDEPASAY